MHIRRILTRKRNSFWRFLKAPRMRWGYKDSSGVWRERTRISDSVSLYHPERIAIGDNVFIGHYSHLDGTGGLVISKGCQIAGWNGIYTHSSHVSIRLYGEHYVEVDEDNKVGYFTAPVRLEKYVFLGVAARVFPGVTIGKGAFVQAMSVVTKDVDEYQIVSGYPAKVVGDTRGLDAKYLKDPLLEKWYQEWQK